MSHANLGAPPFDLFRLFAGLEIVALVIRSDPYVAADTKDIDINFQDKIVCGKFVDEEKPTFLEMKDAHYQKILGDRYVPMPPEGGMLHGQD